mmetsp:Transcript_23822/g.74553  ORF Transcript_23822/g.74553 Transcript_23822/m.74553 type:complete len:282 (+) Transcript_23822:387-1232(+)
MLHGGGGGEEEDGGGEDDAAGHAGEENDEDEDVERDAEEVVDGGAAGVGDEAGLEGGDGGEVDADGDLEEQKRQEAEEGVEAGEDGGDGEGGGGEEDEGVHGAFGGHVALRDAEDAGPAGAAEHHDGEYFAVGRGRGGAHGEGGCPLEDEGVHGGLEGGGDEADEEDAGVGGEVGEAEAEGVERRRQRETRGGGAAVVLGPGGGDDEAPDAEDEGGEVEGRRVTADHDAGGDGPQRPEVRGPLAGDAGEDGDDRVARLGVGEDSPERAGLEAASLVLGDEP